jgi:hypothetical protein
MLSVCLLGCFVKAVTGGGGRRMHDGGCFFVTLCGWMGWQAGMTHQMPENLIEWREWT